MLFVGLLRRSLYGTRSAAKNWQLQPARDLTALGFVEVPTDAAATTAWRVPSWRRGGGGENT